MRFDPVVVIPVYNHGPSALRMVQAVRAQGWPCIVVDDGSRAECAALLDEAARDPGVRLLRWARNRGKGAAVVAALHEALARGHSHALQIDADGQHDAMDIPRFFERSRARPDAVICGTPLYDASVPKGRLVGRYVTHVWVWINTLSLDVRDSMCGYRLYPLAATQALLERASIGERMEFDTEIIVRLHWQGVPVVNLPTRVTYPRSGVSHFRMWRDNLRISGMHARLFAGMLARLPWLLGRRLRRSLT